MKLATLALTAATLVLAGCASYDTEHHGSSVQIEPTHNFLGIITTSPGSYVNNEDAISNTSTSELWARRDFSGDNISLLWGAITISDY